jgi:hypothetical protein
VAGLRRSFIVQVPPLFAAPIGDFDRHVQQAAPPADEPSRGAKQEGFDHDHPLGAKTLSNTATDRQEPRRVRAAIAPTTYAGRRRRVA